MSELEKATSGAAPSTSGEGNVGGTEQESTSGDTSSYDAKFVEKLKREKLNTTSALRQKEQEIEDLRRFKAEIEEQKLLDEKQFKTLVDNYKNENLELKNKLKAKDEMETRAKKNSAVMKELSKLGFAETETNKSAAVKLFDLGGVEVDPTTNVVVGAEEAAKSFYEKFSGLGFFNKRTASADHKAPNINLNQGQVDLESMKREDKYKLLEELANKR